ncbi:MAG: S-layer homology domain-containing protein [Firmicutes bacterium]|nr:S-layer homology domain-containing protein [Bacillota bacterium]
MTFGKRPLLIVAGVLVALALGIMCPVPGLAAAEEPGFFTDVSPGDPNVIFIRYLKKSGLASGRPDGTFGPREPLTRAGALCLITGAEAGGGVGQAASLFSDVPPDHWAAGVIGGAYSKGLARGYPDGTFLPDAPVTRAEAVSFLFNWAGQKSFSGTASGKSGGPDGHWAAGVIAASIDAGLISADEGGAHPDDGITRGDFCRAMALTYTQRPGASRVALKGVLNAEKGPVSVVIGGEAKTAETPLAVLPGMMVKTGGGAAAEIVFEDGSVLRIEENTTLTVINMEGVRAIGQDGTPITSIDSLRVRLDMGKLVGALTSPQMFNIKVPERAITAYRKDRSHILACATEGWGVGLLANLGDGEKTDNPEQAGPEEIPWYLAAADKRVRVTVDMPWSVGGIRGTFWINQVTESSQTTSVLRGEAVFSSGGRTVTVGGGQSTFITASGSPPASPGAMGADEVKEWAGRDKWIAEKARIIEKSLPINSATLPVALPPGKKPAERAGEVSDGKAAPEKGPKKDFDLPSELMNSINSAAKAAGMNVTVKLNRQGPDKDEGKSQDQEQNQGQSSGSKDSSSGSKDSSSASKDSSSKDSSSGSKDSSSGSKDSSSASKDSSSKDSSSGSKDSSSASKDSGSKDSSSGSKSDKGGKKN